jgi:hypothetical protein
LEKEAIWKTRPRLEVLLKTDVPEKEWRVITDEIGPCEGGWK